VESVRMGGQFVKYGSERFVGRMLLCGISGIVGAAIS